MTLLRSLLFNLYFFGLTLACSLYGVLLNVIAPRRLLGLVRLWGRWLCWGAARICGIRLVVIGREYIPGDGAALLASQHQSAFDTFVWLTLLPRPSYVVKQELARIPLFGRLLRPAGMIVVDRSAGAAALRRLLRDGDAAVADRRQIVIFPEGTRTAPGERLELQPGIAALAARTRLPVVPVATDSGLRWGRRSFLKRPGPIHVMVQPPLPAGLSREVLMERLQAAWAEAERRVEPVDKSVGDVHALLP